MSVYIIYVRDSLSVIFIMKVGWEVFLNCVHIRIIVENTYVSQKEHLNNIKNYMIIKRTKADVFALCFPNTNGSIEQNKAFNP